MVLSLLLATLALFCLAPGSLRAARDEKDAEPLQLLQKMQKKRGQEPVPPAGAISEILVQKKPSGGLFMVFRFPLSFNSHVLYWRRFGVDVPADIGRCQSSGCPVLVDFPGSGGSIYSQRGWTQWYAYQDQLESEPFLLVTMEGSPDAVVPEQEILPCSPEQSPQECADESSGGDGYTSWNVLGWGVPTDLQTDPNSSLLSACFPAAVKPWNSYQCFATHLLNNPNACHKVSEAHQKAWSAFSQIPMNCISASGANDWDYVRTVLQAVTEGAICRATVPGGWCGDRSRIFFSGQSMGGMSALQFATPDPTSRYFLGSLRPAAVAACSPGGSRNNDLELQGQVPTLLLQGSRDLVAVPVPWAGHDRDLVRITLTSAWKALVTNDTLVQLALRSLPAAFHNFTKTSILLLADVRQGGAALLEHLPNLTDAAGFPDRKGRMTGISAGAYMWEPVQTTLQRIVGKEVQMAQLSYWTPQALSSDPVAIALQCADATALTRVCIFQGGHTYPFLKPNGFEDDPSKARAFHELLWADWFRNGTLRAPRPVLPGQQTETGTAVAHSILPAVTS
ncbi:hypothetical protein AK812_SmicGene19826 [Symbiodinium microadriaticum]|uniref:Uncharacterized protein n=2 Tax=Symbiodinium TaxID=2949 RepID=A0A1Q9DRI5_SYMMI|nr:hypothetical protein AK812_SmicGene19826 [Symbiodinium microadriaticum]